MNVAALQKNISDSTFDHCSQFKAIADEITKMADSVNIKIVPYYSDQLEHFVKLDSDIRKNILNSLQVYLNVYKAVQSEGSSLLDSVRVIWNALAQLGYRPASDLFSYINSGNIIEIHNNQLVQVFRNLTFFNYCSYSLEELYCYKMPELYTRDLTFEHDLMKYVQQIYSGEIKSIIKTELKPHTITELASRDRLHITDDIHYIAPLFDAKGGHQAVATLCIESARIEDAPAHTTSQIEKSPTTNDANNIFAFKQPVSSDSGLLA